MKQLNTLLLAFVAVILFSCSDDSSSEKNSTEKEFIVDTLMVYEMTNRVQSIGPALQHFADSIAQLHDGRACPINYKTVESAIRKCWTDSCQANELNDLVRLTIACPFDSLRSMITDLANTAKKQSVFYRYKHQEALDRGYWGDIVNLKYDGSLVSEIQVKSYYMAYACYEGDLPALLGDSIISCIRTATGKEPALSHHYYEIIRDITGKYTDKDKEQANKESYDYMLLFWEGYKPGMTFYEE